MPAPTAAPDPMSLLVLISGGGSTMVNLQQQITAGKLPARISRVIASRPCAGVDRAAELELPCEVLNPKSFPSLDAFSNALFDTARTAGAELIVLAGFLSPLVIPDDFSNRVMNIHPSLIPAFCGKGMYGHHVHSAVIARGCKVSGCTVHFCDNEYDHGPIILQQTVPVDATDTLETLAARVQAAECEVYPRAIQLYAEQRLQVVDGKVHVLDVC